MREKLGVLSLEVIPYTSSPEYVESGWLECTFTLTSREIIFSFGEKHAMIPIERITEVMSLAERDEMRVKKGVIAIGYTTKQGEIAYALLRGPELLISALRCALIALTGKKSRIEQPLNEVERGLVLLLYLNVRNKSTQEFLLATFGEELREAIATLRQKGFIDENNNLTPKGIKFLRERQQPLSQPPSPPTEFKFPEAARMFGMSIVLEAKMRHFIKNTQIPNKEIRKFFENPQKSELFEFLRYYIKRMGVGEIEIKDFMPFAFTISVKNNTVPDIYITPPGKKACFVLSHFFYRLFTECFKISASVEETACVREGKESCLFRVEVQPFKLYLTILNAEDGEHLKNLDAIGAELLGFYEALSLVKGRELTENGKVFLAYIERYGIEKWEDFPPPWHSQKIDPRIALDAEFRKLFEDSWQRIRE